MRLLNYLFIYKNLKGDTVSSAVIFQVQSFLIMALMGYGISQHKIRTKHYKIMGSAIAWDILLILQIELTRSAILKASKIMTNPMMLKIHLFFAISSVVLYFIMIHSGRKVLAGDNSMLTRHRLLGWVTFAFRILTFATSFWAVTK